MPSWTPDDVLRQRLTTQRLLGNGLPSATDVVQLLAAVQSQEHAHAFWSLGMRSTGPSLVDVRREFDEGRFLRTHVLRPTWHFVAAEDIRWMLAITAPRVHQLNRTQGRQLGLDQSHLDRGNELIVAALADGQHLTRKELSGALEHGGLSTEGIRLVYFVMTAELDGLICSGAMRGAQHTYAAMSQRVPPTPALSEEQALAELAWRYFSGHGPSSLKDFTRWSSLTTAAARSGLEAVGDRLGSVEVDGQTLWFDPHLAEAAEGAAVDDAAGEALLVPLYDELTLSYPQLNFPVAPGHPHPPDADLFIGTVLLDRRNVGTWRRTVKGRSVLVETWLSPELTESDRARVRGTVSRLADFLDKELQVSEC